MPDEQWRRDQNLEIAKKRLAKKRHQRRMESFITRVETSTIGGMLALSRDVRFGVVPFGDATAPDTVLQNLEFGPQSRNNRAGNQSANGLRIRGYPYKPQRGYAAMRSHFRWRLDLLASAPWIPARRDMSGPAASWRLVGPAAKPTQTRSRRLRHAQSQCRCVDVGHVVTGARSAPGSARPVYAARFGISHRQRHYVNRVLSSSFDKSIL